MAVNRGADERGAGAADRRREQILSAAIDCIGEVGFDGLSMRAVSQRAGVPLGSLHYYFPSKEDMVGAALERSVDALVTTVAGAVDPTVPPRLRLRRLLAEASARLTADPRTFPIYVGFWSWCRQVPERRDLYRTVSLRLHDRVLELVEDGVRRGDYRVHDADAVATLATSALVGFILDQHGMPEGADRAMLDRLVDALEVVLGVRPSA